MTVAQATEHGTVYSPDQLGALADAAHAAGMLLHVDGARIANALVAMGTDPATMLRDTGVDLMTFGLTKDGAMYGEVVVYLRPELAEHARAVRKQAGQLPSKARFVAAQVLALLDDDLWLRNARHANDQAGRLAAAVGPIPGVDVALAVETNAVFATIPSAAIEPLQDWSFFWPWDPALDLVRWMTSFTTTDDVDRFAAGVAAVVAEHQSG